MRTNKACPKFVGDESMGSINVALTAEDEELMEKRLEEENLLSSGTVPGNLLLLRMRS